MAKPKHKLNTRTVDIENLEENIKGVFFDILERGGVDINSIDALQKVKHNPFNAVLMSIYDALFKPNGTLPNNQLSILPYGENEILEKMVDIYISLCSITDNDSTIQGFCFLYGIKNDTVTQWMRDELNPERMGIIKKIVHNRVDMIENKLSDHPIGTTALANNSTSLGMLWARNNAQLQSQKAVYIIPADATRGLPASTEIGGNLPQIIEDGTI